jgi:hypothetical protein
MIFSMLTRKFRGIQLVVVGRKKHGKVAIVAATEAGHNLACTKGPSARRFRAEFLLESPLLLNLVHRRFKNWQKNGRLSRRFQSLRLIVAKVRLRRS